MSGLNISQYTTTINNFTYSTQATWNAADGHDYEIWTGFELAMNGGSLISSQEITQVHLWVPETAVNNSPGTQVTLPGPSPMTQPKSTFTYPQAPQFALVVVQVLGGLPKQGENVKVNYVPIPIEATTYGNRTVVYMDCTQANFFIAFNDLVGTYGDNSGDLEIMMETFQ